MGKYCQLVIGPAGSGKSTFCETIQQHGENVGRSIHVVNLDPAAEDFKYNCSVDIRELISLDDVAEDEELKFGPNGGLVFCFEFLMENLEWLRDELGEYENDYIIIDCPGQIELYSHFTYMRQLVDTLQQWDYRVCAVYIMDAQFMSDRAKFFAGTLSALSAMIRLEVPHINVLSKMDLLGRQKKSRDMERFLVADTTLLTQNPGEMGDKFYRLNEAIARLIDEYSLVQFEGLDRDDPDSVSIVLAQIDNAIQFGEDQEPSGKFSDDEEHGDDD